MARRAGAGLAVAGVDSGGEPLAHRDPFQELAQLRALGRAEASADVVFVGRARAGQLAHERRPGPGQVHGVVAPVIGVAAPLDEPALFQAVDQQHQPGGRGAQRAGELLLALARLPRDQAQQPGLGRGEAERPDALGEPARRVRAQLGEQERVPRPARRRPASGRFLRAHETMIHT